MKYDFRIDFRTEYGAYYTTFPPTETSLRILEKNRTSQLTGANELGKTMGNQARSEAKQHLLKGNIDLTV
ncbi:MAG: hypothetical protein U9R66_13535 [Thermodesulfobacteriota bacterium]|nr:hypothetical protein [Thermodesulfobacteriota bacterium]